MKKLLLFIPLLLLVSCTSGVNGVLLDNGHWMVTRAASVQQPLASDVTAVQVDHCLTREVHNWPADDVFTDCIVKVPMQMVPSTGYLKAVLPAAALGASIGAGLAMSGSDTTMNQGQTSSSASSHVGNAGHKGHH